MQFEFWLGLDSFLSRSTCFSYFYFFLLRFSKLLLFSSIIYCFRFPRNYHRFVVVVVVVIKAKVFLLLKVEDAEIMIIPGSRDKKLYAKAIHFWLICGTFGSRYSSPKNGMCPLSCLSTFISGRMASHWVLEIAFVSSSLTLIHDERQIFFAKISIV